MLRFFIPLILLLVSLLWSLYVLFVKKNVKLVKNILSLTAFFAVIWSGIYYFLFY